MAPKKILLAEDDADDREMFSSFLTERDDVVLACMAENGVDAMDSLGKIKAPGDLPDLVILDQNMPKQNGLQTLKLLKEDTRYESIPVFVYSTYADKSMEAKSIEAGAVAVFSKPYTVEGYHQMLNEMLEMVTS